MGVMLVLHITGRTWDESDQECGAEENISI
jgi:hypothetical protein